MKVLVPNMPTADDLLPYLRRMDAARVYVNGGELVQALEARMRTRTGAPAAAVSNGTLALELALRAMDMPAGAEVLVPAVTFKASAQAIVNAGLTPVLCDVDPGLWRLQPDYAARVAAARPAVRCAMPVAAFGLPVPAFEWHKFAESTGVNVLVDAAGALLDQLVPDRMNIAVAYSLHATKAVGAGEGGIVCSSNEQLVRRVSRLAAFGPGGTNAKMSEYHAAVALASLDIDRLQLKLMRSAELTRWYAALPFECRTQFGAQAHRTLMPVLLPRGASVAHVEAAFTHAGIETKRWYWPFLHELHEFNDCPRADDLPVSCDLSDRLLGLPFHDFMTEADAARVIETLRGALQ